MGLFYSIPKDVFKNCILIHVLSFRDRIRLFMTCKDFYEKRKDDPLTKHVESFKFQEGLSAVVQLTGNHYNSFEYFTDYISSMDSIINTNFDYIKIILPYTTDFRILKFTRNILIHDRSYQKKNILSLCGIVRMYLLHLQG
jgi:hypothetical protein